MTKSERINWIINIECITATIHSELSADVINSVFRRYGAYGPEDASPSDLPAIYNELHAIESDMK